MQNITDVFVRAVVPTDKVVTHWDSNLRGFGLRVNPKGAKSFVVLIGSGNRKTLGRYPHLSLAEARSEAKRILAEKTLGKLNRVRVPFETAKKLFLEHADKTTRPKTAYEYQRILDAHYKFTKNLADISAHELVQILHKLNDTPSEKHHAFVVGRIFFNWCKGQHYLERSPLENILVPTRPFSRDRYLDEEELRTIVNTAAHLETTFDRIVMLLLFTAQRRAQIANLRWSWIQSNRITFPASIMKGGKEHVLPIDEGVNLVLARCPKFEGSDLVFPAMRTARESTTIFNGWSKAKKQFDIDCGTSNWTLHDIRRTFASIAPTLGIPQVVTEHILNHVSGGSQSQIARVYNKYSYYKEMEKALFDWQLHLCNLLEPGP